jgi:hypothetical protein
VERIQADYVTFFVEDSDTVLADQNNFGVPDFKLLAIRRCYNEGAKTTAGYEFLKFFDAHKSNVSD